MISALLLLSAVYSSGLSVGYFNGPARPDYVLSEREAGHGKIKIKSVEISDGAYKVKWKTPDTSSVKLITLISYCKTKNGYASNYIDSHSSRAYRTSIVKSTARSGECFLEVNIEVTYPRRMLGIVYKETKTHSLTKSISSSGITSLPFKARRDPVSNGITPAMLQVCYLSGANTIPGPVNANEVRCNDTRNSVTLQEWRSRCSAITAEIGVSESERLQVANQCYTYSTRE